MNWQLLVALPAGRGDAHLVAFSALTENIESVVGVVQRFEPRF